MSYSNVFIAANIKFKSGSLVENKVKDEDFEGQMVPLDLPDITEANIFDDVDVEDEASEYVDGNFEGLAFINSVEHFVCPGEQSGNILCRFPLTKTLLRVQDSTPS